MKNTDSKIFKIDRRTFLKTTSIGATGLLLGIQYSCTSPTNKLKGDASANFSSSVYLNINGSGEVTIIAHRSEMGTGIRTSLPLIVADELEADWKQVKVVQAVGDKKYGDQNTDGSYSVRMFYPIMRKAGAAARMMLEQAAANEWQIDVGDCKAQNHGVTNKDGEVLGFGYLADKAALLPIPEEVDIQLKSPDDFKFIGKKTSIVDLEDIVTGKAIFGLDTKVAGAKVALVKRPPVAGGKVKTYNVDAALKIPGVSKIFTIDSPGFPISLQSPLGGVVVVADNTWAAMKGREALTVTWERGVNGDYNSTAYIESMMKKARVSGKVRRAQGSANSALAKAAKKVEGDFRVHHLSHAPMETPCAIANFKNDKIEVWAPTQEPQWARGAVGEALGLEEKDVTINVTLLGGAFGRKSKPDFIVEAALISKESGFPIKLLWTREDDIQHDYYHANCAQHIGVGIDDNNKVNSWVHRTVFPAIGSTSSAQSNEPSGEEISQGVIDLPYDIPNISCETNTASAQVRVGWLRSVANINHAFAIGCMLDEVAEKRGLDPVANLLDMLGQDRNIDMGALSEEFWNYGEKIEEFPWSTARYRKVIEKVKEISGWGKAMPPDSGIGIAAHRSFLSYVACVVEVKMVNGKLKIPRVYYAVDCGVAVNPERIKAQFEGGAVFGASIALKSKITVSHGAVAQSNFNDYELARITEAPLETEVFIVPSNEKPTGVGEPPVPPFAPALCNALYQVTGKRIRQLPVKL
ncbi:MAG: xanthine dehydrogenase family protein molybdopterin-binding subunit [Cyclobacteriaceae bacterium]|nr:xanthine dehydrogenase family protein molybdopterin-binding subunit [Cyclobacteriaceae bacterium]